MLAYVNGEFAPIEEASVSIWDRGFTIGEGVFEAWRTYGGRPVAEIQERHLLRLTRSLRFIEFDPDEVIDTVRSVWSDVVDRNHDEILAAGDVWVITIVTGGTGDEGADRGKPTLVVAPKGIPFGQGLWAGAELFNTGAHLIPSLMTRNPFLPSDPRVKSISRMSNTRNERKQVRAGAGAVAITFDNDGTITEATVKGIAIIEDGRLIVPPRRKRLDSVSLQITCKLAADLGIEVQERDLTVYDILNAEEVYLFGTSFAMMPVADLDGIPVRGGREVGDRLLAAWIEFVGFDFVDQAKRLDSSVRGEAARA